MLCKCNGQSCILPRAICVIPWPTPEHTVSLVSIEKRRVNHECQIENGERKLLMFKSTDCSAPPSRRERVLVVVTMSVQLQAGILTSIDQQENSEVIVARVRFRHSHIVFTSTEARPSTLRERVRRNRSNVGITGKRDGVWQRSGRNVVFDIHKAVLGHSFPQVYPVKVSGPRLLKHSQPVQELPKIETKNTWGVLIRTTLLKSAAKLDGATNLRVTGSCNWTLASGNQINAMVAL
jgi:hypothetical protein